MATYKKLQSGRWQAQVARSGVRRARSFRTKREAQDWASREEYLITEGDAATAAAQKLRDVFGRYAREVSATKRGERWEVIRLERLSKDKIADIRVSEVTPSDFADWRDRRLTEVAPASVSREMTLMSAVMNVARREWGLIKVNPLADVRKPSPPPPRDRRVSPDEIDALVKEAGTDLSRVRARAVHAFRFAVETAMRAGEIVGLTWENVDAERRVAHLPRTKNGSSRDVPLSTAAVALLQDLPGREGRCFDLRSDQLDVMFRRARDGAGIENLRFHDSRHEAITRLARKVDVLPLARIVGHKDIKMLMVYYNETAEDLARRLD